MVIDKINTYVCVLLKPLYGICKIKPAVMNLQFGIMQSFSLLLIFSIFKSLFWVVLNNHALTFEYVLRSLVGKHYENTNTHAPTKMWKIELIKYPGCKTQLVLLLTVIWYWMFLGSKHPTEDIYILES